MDQQQFISRTLEKIKQEKIRPKPSWKLSLPNYLFWLMFFAMIVLTDLSFSMIFHLTWDMDWEVFEYVKKRRIAFLFKVLPFFWIMALLLFALTSYINIRQTRKGYRYNTTSLAAVIVGTALGMGSLIWVTEANDKIQQALTQKIPYMNSFMNTPEKIWNQPEMGVLSGEIVSAGEDRIDIVDFDGNVWRVVPDEETMVMPAVKLEEKEKVKIIGKKNEDQCCQFKAKEIDSWQCQKRDNCQDRKNVKTYKKVKEEKKHQEPAAKGASTSSAKSNETEKFSKPDKFDKREPSIDDGQFIKDQKNKKKHPE